MNKKQRRPVTHYLAMYLDWNLPLGMLYPHLGTFEAEVCVETRRELWQIVVAHLNQ
jgi:hypothetical protein